ncbi:hypothetical protein [Subtercola boreus]|uniref:Uncharacterized protein n=1 Tax=Subtercola boreus TaxID=120213 RepID=A0A3E0W9L4_9MICO|nr:hypothetical protein [Subtercola boreus]RFA19064.1 hypothetical protein B7R24_13110 [Subtercola boreus]RFA19202.1 hypothetical protein B7R23_13090 [Subtercola boreus]RFA25664.1 hypothetical protein B7R25_13210 [Subtercola boreus]
MTMRELHYGSGVMTVSFDVCSAVFDYAVALANAGKTDRITVPVLIDGQRGFSNLLLGPNTQLYCSAVPDRAKTDDTDLDDAALVGELSRKGSLLGAHPQVRPSSGALGIDLADLDTADLD